MDDVGLGGMPQAIVHNLKPKKGGNHRTRRILMQRELSHWMTGIEYQRLLIGHFGQILHYKKVLCPILKNSAVTTIGNQLMRMLSNCIIEIIAEHISIIHAACIHLYG